VPKLSTQRLTKRFIDSLDAKRDVIIFDADLRGFGVRVKPRGVGSPVKTYLVQYKHDGRTRRMSLGQHGKLTPEQARTRAKALLGRVASGENPAEAKTQKAITVRELCEEYLAAAEAGRVRGRRGLPKKPSTLATDKGRIERHIVKLLGARRVRDLTPRDIEAFMHAIESGETRADVKTRKFGLARVRGGAGAASRTVGLLGGILSFAVTQGVVAHNPARGVKRTPDGHRGEALDEGQYAALGSAVARAETEGAAWQAVGAIRLLALTGCRLAEAVKLR
jgi:hypothetical protein